MSRLFLVGRSAGTKGSGQSKNEDGMSVSSNECSLWSASAIRFKRAALLLAASSSAADTDVVVGSTGKGDLTSKLVPVGVTSSFFVTAIEFSDTPRFTGSAISGPLVLFVETVDLTAKSLAVANSCTEALDGAFPLTMRVMAAARKSDGSANRVLPSTGRLRWFLRNS